MIKKCIKKFRKSLIWKLIADLSSNKITLINAVINKLPNHRIIFLTLEHNEYYRFEINFIIKFSYFKKYFFFLEK